MGYHMLCCAPRMPLWHFVEARGAGGMEAGSWCFLSDVITDSTAWAVFQLSGLVKSYRRAGQSLEICLKYKIQMHRFFFFYMNCALLL